MKFYYNGVLIRTSKTHSYTHAVIGNLKADGKYELWGCRSNREAAQQIIDSRISMMRNNIKTYNMIIKALQNGESGWTEIWKGRRFFHRFASDDNVEKYQRWLDAERDRLQQTIETLKVVELEAREK